MERFEIEGGHRLSGSVRAHGSKNAALPIMAATVMIDGETTLSHVPDLIDVRTLARLLETLGMRVTFDPQNRSRISLRIDNEALSVAGYELVRRMRASFCVLGPLLAKRGTARVALPGGCQIGSRPVDVHLRGLTALGAEIRIEHGDVIATACSLSGTEIDLATPSGSTVTGTCNVLSAAVFAEGKTVLTNAAREPEVVAFGEFLNGCGADVMGLGTSVLTVRGVDALNARSFEIIPDRIETGTLLLAAAITRGRITVENTRSSDLASLIDVLTDIGFHLRTDDHTISLMTGNTELKPICCATGPHPGFPTDLQAQLVSLLATIPGESRIEDRVFPQRFGHVAELNRLGAQIASHSGTAIISGQRNLLRGAEVMACDLRASAALVLAGLAAEGMTIVRRIYHLDRGYQQFERMLHRLGAVIRRRPDSEDAQHTFPTPN